MGRSNGLMRQSASNTLGLCTRPMRGAALRDTFSEMSQRGGSITAPPEASARPSPLHRDSLDGTWGEAYGTIVHVYPGRTTWKSR